MKVRYLGPLKLETECQVQHSANLEGNYFAGSSGYLLACYENHSGRFGITLTFVRPSMDVSYNFS